MSMKKDINWACIAMVQFGMSLDAVRERFVAEKVPVSVLKGHEETLLQLLARRYTLF